MSEYKQALIDLTKSLSTSNGFSDSSFLTMAKLLCEKENISLFSSSIPINSFTNSSVIEIILKEIIESKNYFSYDFQTIQDLAEIEGRSFKKEVGNMPNFIKRFQYLLDNSSNVEKFVSPLLLDAQFYLNLPESFWDREDQFGSKSLKRILVSGLIKNDSEKSKTCLKELLDSEKFSLIQYEENSEFISKSSPLFSALTPESLLFVVENGVDLFLPYKDKGESKKLYEFFVDYSRLKEIVFNYLKSEDSNSFNEVSKKKYFDVFSRIGKHNISNIMEAFKGHESYWTLTNEVGANALMIGLYNAHDSFLSKVNAITSKKSDLMFAQLNNFGCSAFHYYWNHENTLNSSSLKILSERCPKLTEDGSGLIVSTMTKLNIKSSDSIIRDEKPFPKLDEKVLEVSLAKKYITPAQIWSGSKEELDQLALYLLSFSSLFEEKNKWDKDVIGFHALLKIIPDEILDKSPLFAGAVAFMKTHFSNSIDQNMFNHKLSFSFATDDFFKKNEHFSTVKNKELEKLLSHNVLLNSFDIKEQAKIQNRF